MYSNDSDDSDVIDSEYDKYDDDELINNFNYAVSNWIIESRDIDG